MIFLLFCRPAFIWALDPRKTPDQYLVDHWEEEADGILSNTVLAIAQTADGYLWFGTSKGLVRFDGVTFKTVRFDPREEVYSQEVRGLLVDREGSLWIGAAVGVTLYDYPEKRFKTFTADDGITPGGIRCMADDMKGNIWISFETGYVNRFSGGIFKTFDASHGLSGKKINAIVEDRRGQLLFGSRERGIFTYKDGAFSKFTVPGLQNSLIIKMHEDRQGMLWIGTGGGLYTVNPAAGNKTRKYTARDGLSSEWITSITEDSEKNVWVGTSQGLNRIKRNQDGSIGFESLLDSFEINCLFVDNEKSLWIGTDVSGIKRLKDGKFTSYAPFESRRGEIPVSLFQDRHGDTWIGTFGGKLFRCRGETVTGPMEDKEFSGTGITAIAGDGAGNLWLGTNGKGVFQKKKDGLVRFTTRQGLADDLVISLYMDSRDNLWVSTMDGMSVRRPGDGTFQSFTSRHGLPGKMVRNVIEDKNHHIWIATDRGIAVLKDGKGAKENIEVYLRGVPVTCIYEDPSAAKEGGGVFWIATDGAGLKRLDKTTGAITSYTTAHGLTTNFIYRFLEDSRGNFWCMSNSGILRVGKNDLNRMAPGAAGQVDCFSYGESDGLKSQEFDNKFSANSALATTAGEFWFITKKGISIVNPLKISVHKSPPPVVIETVLFNREPVSFHPDAGPPAFKDIKYLSFHFTAPTFLSPGKIRFKYMLEGVDPGWVTRFPGQERAAHYKDPPPGTYTFRVTACSAEGVWNPGGESFKFTIEPLFYQTFLFKLALLLLLLTLAAAFYFYKKRKKTSERKTRYKGSTLEPSFAEERITRLKYLMEADRIYCDADLSLQSLAEKLSLAPHQLSQLLNEKLNRNFAEFVNGYRIEEAKKILSSPRGAQRKIYAVAIDVGFNTMAAFYKAFKKTTGMTPTEFKKETARQDKM
jgi:ligand-binding sensor domain-containing protein/AraC-like DNA-binding protein